MVRDQVRDLSQQKDQDRRCLEDYGFRVVLQHLYSLASFVRYQ